MPAGLAHVAVVPTLDDLNFLTVQIDQHGYHTYNLGAFQKLLPSLGVMYMGTMILSKQARDIHTQPN